jgi:tetrapyrrole methylase family protein/MazG family protein
MTAAATAAFAGAARAYVRTVRHPAAVALVARGAVALDDHYERAERIDETYAAITETVIAAAEEVGSVVYGVPGSPLVAESTVEAIRRDPRVDLMVIPGMSFIDLAWMRLEVDPLAVRARLVDAERFAADAAGDVGPLLVAQAWSRALLSEIKLAPENPPPSAVILHHLGLDDEQVLEVRWEDLDRTVEPDHLTSIWIASLAEPVGFELVRAQEIVRVLRQECPWDAAQTHLSLTRHLLEETYETLEAIDELADGTDADAVDHLEEELGDVLCQVLFHATIASEEGLFNLSDVARGLTDKLIRRHPHVFGGSDAPAADEVLASWEQQKITEKGRHGLLEGIPGALPALAVAAKYERRSATVGLGVAETATFDPETFAPIAAAIAAEPSSAGALLFDLARAIAAVGLDPEDALRRAAAAFRARFEAAEASARTDGVRIDELSPEERAARFPAS